MATDWRSAYFEQAHSDFAVYQHLRSLATQQLPLCHTLHYLQMCSEKMAKGFLTRPGAGSYGNTHNAFVTFVRVSKTNKNIQEATGFAGNKPAYLQYINSILPLAQSVEDLSPEGEPHPNPEYPWEAGEELYVPASYAFTMFTAGNGTNLVKMDRFISACLSVAR